MSDTPLPTPLTEKPKSDQLAALQSQVEQLTTALNAEKAMLDFGIMNPAAFLKIVMEHICKSPSIDLQEVRTAIQTAMQDKS